MRSKLRPVLLKWIKAEDRFEPNSRSLAICRTQFEDGKEYPFEVVKPRNMQAHKRYFASIHEAWLNLAEEYKDRFKTDDHLRSWALVKAGYCTETDYPCESVQEAIMVAKIIRSRSSYSVIIRSGNVIKVFDPESQAVYGPNAMDAERFKDSSNAVLDIVSAMARTTRRDLDKNAGRSA